MQLLHLPYILYPFYTTCQEKNKKNQKKTEEKTQKNHRNILRMHFLLDRFDIRCIIGSIPPTRGLTYYPLYRVNRVGMSLNTRLAVSLVYTLEIYKFYRHCMQLLWYPRVSLVSPSQYIYFFVLRAFLTLPTVKRYQKCGYLRVALEKYSKLIQGYFQGVFQLVSAGIPAT